MSKVLVAYFSARGVTRKVSAEVANAQIERRAYLLQRAGKQLTMRQMHDSLSE